MVAVAGEWLDWDLEGVKSLFEDDGFIVAAFLLSSVGMLVFGIIIRTDYIFPCCVYLLL